MSALAYDQDFYGWTQEQARLLWEHRINELDLENLLDNDSFAKLRDWFIEFDQARWDKQLEADSNAGKLDFLINAGARRCMYPVATF